MQLRRTLVIATVVVTLLLAPAVSIASSILVSASNMELGSQQDVLVEFLPTEETEVFGIEVHLSFDPSILRVVGVDTGEDIESWGGPVFHVGEDGTLGIAIASAYSVIDPQKLFIVRFESVALGESPIDISRAVINETLIEDRRSATVDVQTVEAKDCSLGQWKLRYIR